MKHIIQIVSDTNIGGAGRYLLNYLKYFDRDSFRVSVVIPEKSKLKDFVAQFSDVTLYEVPYMADRSYDKKCVSYLKKLFRKENPDIVHTHASLSARIAAKACGVKRVIATRHCIEDNSSRLKTAALGLVNNTLCDTYIAVSDAVKTNLIESGINPAKIRTVANGVLKLSKISSEEISLNREKLGAKEDETVFGIFARLEKVKGHRYFVKAANQVIKEGYKAKFLVVGDGTEMESIKEMVRHYGLDDKVIFTGYVKDTTTLLNACDVNVISSMSEAMSLSLLEAMSIAKPTIATKVGGNPQVIKNEENGLLVNAKDSSSLSEAMIKLIKDKDLYKKLSQNAENDYESLYRADIMVKNLERIYSEV